MVLQDFVLVLGVPDRAGTVKLVWSPGGVIMKVPGKRWSTITLLIAEVDVVWSKMESSGLYRERTKWGKSGTENLNWEIRGKVKGHLFFFGREPILHKMMYVQQQFYFNPLKKKNSRISSVNETGPQIWGANVRQCLVCTSFPKNKLSGWTWMWCLLLVI